jgi:hypothetical protein
MKAITVVQNKLAHLLHGLESQQLMLGDLQLDQHKNTISIYK